MTHPKMNRRGVLCGATALSALFVGRAFGATFAPTASETAGPFYPAVLPKESDNDLTKMAGHQPAKGQVIEVLGRVLGPDGQPRKGAVVEIWQANAVGRYAHPSDPSKQPVDDGFQGWGKAITAADGRYRFVTIIPGSYPAASGWTRPPHIHFKVTPIGQKTLTTQMYFARAAKLNRVDGILGEHSLAQRAALTVAFKPNAAGVTTGTFDIVV